MSSVINNAASAERYARYARNSSNDTAISELAKAVEYLAKAVADLSREHASNYR